MWRSWQQKTTTYEPPVWQDIAFSLCLSTIFILSLQKCQRPE